MAHINPARTSNFIMTFGDDRETTFSVQDIQTPDVTLGETPFSVRAKDLFMPSNKMDTTPVTISILASEKLSEYINCLKWLLTCKNTNESDKNYKTVSIIVLDSNSNRLCEFNYVDCFPTNISSLVYTTNSEDNNVITFDVTLRYNRFRLLTSENEIIDEDYSGV